MGHRVLRAWSIPRRRLSDSKTRWLVIPLSYSAPTAKLLVWFGAALEGSCIASLGTLHSADAGAVGWALMLVYHSGYGLAEVEGLSS
jgi:hypothetical protein